MAASRKIYLFANWKMYLDFDESNILANGLAQKFSSLSKKIEMVIFPSALSFYTVSQVLSDVKIKSGAQNIHQEDKGGFTGEISAQMYRDAGAKYALVGHSERRHLFHETNHEIREKMEAVLNNKLIPVLCVGETLKERMAGQTNEVLEIQLRSALHGLDFSKLKKLFIAYEPVWAISRGLGAGEAGKHCDALEAQKIHQSIQKMVKSLAKETEVVILFGGSVRENTVSEYLSQPNIDGVLVGAASTHLDSWAQIVHNAL